MKEQFIPYELALKLKELGFDEYCLTFYNFDSNLEMSDDWVCGADYEFKRDRNQCLAPLWQQAFDWFRERHRIIFDISSPYHQSEKWHYNIELDNISNPFIRSDYYVNYNEARQVCLEKLIEIAQKENKND